MIFKKVYIDRNSKNTPPPQKKKQQPTCKIVNLGTAGNKMNYGKQNHLKLGEAERF